MSFPRVFLLFFGLISTSLFAQTTYEAVAPDSIKKKCDEVIISEIGKTAFTNHVKYIKCDAFKSNNENKYTIFYSFTFPNVKESHVVFSLDYKSGKGVIKDGAFKNFTRLPASVKAKGIKVISYSDAKKTALASDPIFNKDPKDLFGEISTEYDEKKKDYFFVWYFYHITPCVKCADQMYTMKSLYIDAVSGSVIKTEKSSN